MRPTPRTWAIHTPTGTIPIRQAHGIHALRDRDGYTYLAADDGRSELVTGYGPAETAPDHMPNGLYTETDRPNITWIKTGRHAMPIHTVPASLLKRHAPYHQANIR